MLDITDVRVKRIEKGNFLGYASVCISDLVVIKEIKLFEGKDGRYILMPGIKLREQGRVRNFAYPIKDEARLQILKAISEKYDEECANSEIIEDED